MRFLDSSAIVKLALAEPESGALETFLGDVRFASSALARTEVIRAIHRREPPRLERGRALVEQAQLVEVTTAVLERAARLDPPSLRSLDAIHLASALLLGDELEAFVAYDERLLAAASGLGMPIAAPGSDLAG